MLNYYDLRRGVQFILDEFPKVKSSGDLTSAQIQLLIAKARKA